MALVATLFLGIGICLCTDWLTERVQVHEGGVHLMLKGREVRFRYCDVEQLAVQDTDHFANRRYVGTRMTMDIQIEGRIRPVLVDLETRKADKKRILVDTMIDLINTAIQKRMMDELEANGQVRWTPDVSLTLDGLMVHDGGTETRLIPLETITDVDRVDNNSGSSLLIRRCRVWC